PHTALSSHISLVISPLPLFRIPTLVEQGDPVIAPRSSVDVIVTENGIAIIPQHRDLVEPLKNVDVPQFTIEELKEKAYAIVGTPQPIEYGEKDVALIQYRDGTMIDVVRNV